MTVSRPRVVAVAQAFKGTLAVTAVAEALNTGIRAAGAVPQVLAASDGGDGLLEALAPRLTRRTAHVVAGPLGRELEVEAGWLDDAHAVVESRLVCGLSLLAPEARDPARTTTRGVGQLVAALAAAGAGRVSVGLGGSATMDGGLGMARAWGWRALDAAGRALPEGGGALERLAALEPGHPAPATLIGLADVDSLLLGAQGARRFAEQKGASPAVAQQLERGLERLVAATRPWRGPALAGRPGAGAAGGLGFGLLVFGGATLVPGARWVLDAVGWPAALAGADLVVTGEGAFDGTSLAGKLTGVVLADARAAGVPAALVAPRAVAVPDGVTVEQGGGPWDAAALAQRTAAAVGRALRLPPG